MDILVITDTPHVDNVALNSTVQPYFPFRVVTVAFPGRNALVFFFGPFTVTSDWLFCRFITTFSVVGKGMFSETSQDKLYVLRAS